MPLCRFDVIIAANDNNPKNLHTNRWHFSLFDADEPTAQLVVDALAAFYSSDVPGQPAGSANIKNFMGPQSDFTTVRFKAYNLLDPGPDGKFHPFYDEQFTLGVGNDVTPLPSEVAVAMNYNSVTPAGGNPQRHENRIFIGKLGIKAQENIGGVSKVSAAFRAVIVGAAARLYAASDLAPDWGWVTHSEAEGPLDAQIVRYGWVDRAFDTQRKRGEADRARSTWTSL